MNAPPPAASQAPKSGPPGPAGRPPRPARPWRPRILRIARLLILVYLGYAAMLFSLQTRMIFPGHETQGQPFAEVKPRPGTELVRLETRQGESIVALFGPALTADGQIGRAHV